MSDTLGPRELAALAGISTDTLRHYERCGVLAAPARTAGGYRRYPADAATRVALVRRALKIGFTLKDLARVLRERDRGAAPCLEVRAIVGDRLAKVDQEIADLRALKTELTALLRNWDLKLSKIPANRQARLLDGLGCLHGKTNSKP